MTEHITDERLLGFITGRVDLTNDEQEHIRNCETCNDRFRMIVTSDDEAKAS